MEKESKYAIFLEEVKRIDAIPLKMGTLDTRISKLSDLVEKLYPEKMFKCDNSGKGCEAEIRKPGFNPNAYNINLWQIIYSMTVYGKDICSICEMKKINEVSWLEGIKKEIYNDAKYEDYKKMAA